MLLFFSPVLLCYHRGDARPGRSTTKAASDLDRDHPPDTSVLLPGRRRNHFRPLDRDEPILIWSYGRCQWKLALLYSDSISNEPTIHADTLENGYCFLYRNITVDGLPDPIPASLPDEYACAIANPDPDADSHANLYADSHRHTGANRYGHSHSVFYSIPGSVLDLHPTSDRHRLGYCFALTLIHA